MKDNEYGKRGEEVRRIIMMLESGKLSEEEGERLMQRGLELLNEMRLILDNRGSGVTYSIDENREIQID